MHFGRARRSCGRRPAWSSAAGTKRTQALQACNPGSNPGDRTCLSVFEWVQRTSHIPWFTIETGSDPEMLLNHFAVGTDEECYIIDQPSHQDQAMPGISPTAQGGGWSKELFIFARFHASEGRHGTVADLLLEETIAARADPGCISHQVFRSTRDPRLFFIHSHWSDEGAFKAHLKLPHTIRFAEQVEPLLDHELEVTRTRPIRVS